MGRILLIDNDMEFSEIVAELLRGQGHEVVVCEEAEEGLKAVTGRPFEVVLLDHRMPGMSGLDFLDVVKERKVRVPVVLMTSFHNDRTAIQAINKGAFAYVIKPLDHAAIMPELEPLIRKAIEINRPLKSVVIPQPDAGADDDSALVGRSKAMLKVLMAIGQVSKRDEAVLILGETGTGKDLVAQAIHTNSARCHKPFVVMNCAAMIETLLGSELFGHVPGAFTGADRVRKGRFEHADGGTLFLDEIGDMPLGFQPKLLRVLQNHEVVRLGTNDPIRVDVRILAATHRDLKAMVRAGTFREDLYFRLEGLAIHLPPLRERKEDVELLAQCFLRRLVGTSGGPELHPAALERLRGHDWPGNVRQLQKVLCRAVGNCRGSQILAEDLDLGGWGASSAAGDKCTDLEGVRRRLWEVVDWAWRSGQGGLWPLLENCLERELMAYAAAQPAPETKLAERLGMARNTYRDRLRKYGLTKPASGD